jgi:gliding motility-associated-like protein
MIRIICLCWTLLGCASLWAQYQTAGSASSLNIPGVPGDCFIVTPDIPSQNGAFWSTQAINLNEPQDIQVTFNLGCKDALGADGMVFVMRGISTPLIGGLGGSLAYGGLVPSLGVELDTWENINSNDSAFDHMSLTRDGGVDHFGPNSLLPPVRILPGQNNAEDCQFHALRVTWDPSTDSLEVYVDCVLRLAYQSDIVNQVYGGDSLVFWGFTGATGGSSNLQQVCVDTIVSTLPPLAFTICEGDTLPLIGVGGIGDEFAWTPGATLSDSLAVNPLAFPTDTTVYLLRFKDPCGLRYEQSITVNVIPSPTLTLGLADTLNFCAGEDSLLDLAIPNAAFLWQDNSSDSTFLVNEPGLIWAEVTSGCTVVRDSSVIVYDTIPEVELGVDLELCEGDTVQLDATDPRATGIFWQDGSSGPTYEIVQGGIYWATLINQCGTASDTVRAVYDSIPRFELGPDQTLCDEQTYLLDAFYREASYLWQDGSTDTTFRVDEPGLYWAQTTNQCGSWRDSVVISYDSLPQVELGEPQVLCEGEATTLGVNWPGAIYSWSTGESSDSITVTTSGTYEVSASNICGITTDAVAITFLPRPEADLGPDTLLCSAEPLLLDLTQDDATYQWSDGSAGATFQTNQAGSYWVVVERAGCFSTDTINVTTGRPPVVSLGDDQLLCDGERATFDVTYPDPSVSYLWSDGSVEPERTIDQAGLYEVTLSNACGDDSDAVTIRTSETPRVELGENRDLCAGDSVILDATFPEATYRWQDGSREPRYLVNQSGIYLVRVETACGESSDEIEVVMTDTAVVDLGSDTVACEGKVIRLRVEPGQGDILWQDGSTEPLLEVRGTGRYAVSVSNACGIQSDEVAIEYINCECPLYAPNAFTPNDDDINETFMPMASCIPQNFELTIYDRWGRVLYRTDQVDQGWRGVSNSGRAVPPGVYVWRVSYQFRGAQGPRQASRSGSVTLLR